MSTACPDRLSLNVIGAQIQLTLYQDCTNQTPEDLTGATVRFVFEKPNYSQVTKTATVDDAAAGIASYTTVSGDIDQVGVWRVWGEYTLASGRIDHSEVREFEVVYAP